jgi:hypothetical protein
LSQLQGNKQMSAAEVLAVRFPRRLVLVHCDVFCCVMHCRARLAYMLLVEVVWYESDSASDLHFVPDRTWKYAVAPESE